VCVLPKGAVVVWLRGQNQALVGRFQAQEATVNFATYYRNADRAKMVREEQVKLRPRCASTSPVAPSAPPAGTRT
jgi:hypothetical protein